MRLSSRVVRVYADDGETVLESLLSKQEFR